MAYLCEVIDQTTNQCTQWVATFNWLDIAITGNQSVAICAAIASYFSVCWIMKESRRAVK
ncbi:hypothetical protein BEN76_05405 [Acinetobacter soli]|uniref:Uncharacterized protein n=1 Tax=Acinetobacter soli TaxID=487316 RepID=A0A1P8EGZ9_9GAMM|nr:hypothetical protein BEN76_05405 [Acinetobacter soli]